MRRLLPLLAVLLVPLTLVLGIYLGGHPDALPGPVRDALVQDTRGQVVDRALSMIESDYYRDVDPDELLDTSLEAAVKSLDDPFSHYFDPEAFAHFKEATSGEFEGVGMTVQEHERGLRIMQTFEGGPAHRAGLRRGDLILEVDGRSIAGKPSEASVALIKGEAGTEVRLTIRSDGERRTETLTRESVTVPVVESRLIRRDDRRVGYVRLDTFTSGAHGHVRRALDELAEQDAEGVVLDLRNNGGGLLNEAVLVSSLFVGEGTIVSTDGRAREKRTYEASGRAIDADLPVVVLVNKGSASASEIVTGALQDRDRATVVGTRTFGKGVFQEVEELPNGGALDITVGEYFTPDGRNLGPRGDEPGGIEPDVEAEDDPDTEPDEALREALRVLRRKL